MKTVDAPVSGSDMGARNAALSIMAGGDKPVVNALMPLFRLMGKNIVYHGKAGSGRTRRCVTRLWFQG
ncbi:MAG: NAD(P)-binding domain-containing protein [Thermodesulfobacteriota bacterium]